MTAERDELHRLVDELPDEDVRAALADVKRHHHPAGDRPWPPAWFGAATATTTDTAARADDLLADGFGRST
jgi:hypothetical protein